ncbi:MAG: threonine/serine exporter family protein [Streptococcaceae bacterium]|jgi:uncharacterized membrane protein YjjB (DUF3815 family)|nr:threonine/serine exporter family protein [Streptococcaceae bacterium]
MRAIILNLLLQLFLCFLATVGFSIICNVSRRILFYCGLVGTGGYFAYWLFMQFSSNMVLATLAGSIIVAILANRMSKLLKMPLTNFNIPGMVPLVPGGIAYNAIRALAEGDYNTFMDRGVETIVVAGAIALGLVIAEAFNHSIRNFVYRFRRIV